MPASIPLPEPAARVRLAEDDDVAAVLEHKLEVAAPNRLLGPPAVLDQPLLADRLDCQSADSLRRAIGVDLDRNRPGLVDATGPHVRFPEPHNVTSLPPGTASGPRAAPGSGTRGPPRAPAAPHPRPPPSESGARPPRSAGAAPPPGRRGSAAPRSPAPATPPQAAAPPPGPGAGRGGG